MQADGQQPHRGPGRIIAAVIGLVLLVAIGVVWGVVGTIRKPVTINDANFAWNLGDLRLIFVRGRSDSGADARLLPRS